jgi:hypothetical protein
MSDDLLARLRAAADNEALSIGAAWALLDEAAEALAEAQHDATQAHGVAQALERQVLSQQEACALASAAVADMAADLAQARHLLAECRPVIERADAVFLPPKGTCTWGPAERDALLARLDAALGGQA